MYRIDSTFVEPIFEQDKSMLRSAAVAVILGVGILRRRRRSRAPMRAAPAFGCQAHMEVSRQCRGTPGWSCSRTIIRPSAPGRRCRRGARYSDREINPTLNVNLNANLHASADLAIIVPSYVFATPVLGGQFAVQMGTIVGTTSANVNGTLTAALPPFAVMRTDSIGDTVTGVGDL